MKRVLLATVATIAGLVALLDFKSHSPLRATGTPSGGLPSASIPSATAPVTTGPSTPRATTTPSGPGGTPATSRTATATTRTFTGTAVQTQYGIVQVKVTVSGTKLTDAAFVQLTAFDGRSQQINSDAAPILLQETLSAQSANISSVSGASFTSAAYVQSLQSALDQAGIR